MPQYPSSPSIFTFFTITLTFLICALSSPAVLAQKFRPTSDVEKCSAFVEGQAFYLLGRTSGDFVLDLSVSWNTSDPAYKKLEGGPSKMDRQACAMINDGEDLFVVSMGAAYIYNVKSNTWKPFSNANFALEPSWGLRYFAVTDPETGIIYLPSGGTDFTGRKLMLSVDIKTETVNTSKSNSYAKYQPVWSTYLKGFVVPTEDYGLMTFTPSNVTQSSDGWNLLNTIPMAGWIWDCAASAYGGSMIVSFTFDSDLKTPSTTYIYDVAKQNWKEGPRIPGVEHLRHGSSCAVSGDQFIVWGGMENETYVNTTRVFNIKTNKWVSRYTPPAPRPTTTTLQPLPTPSTALESGNTSSRDKKLVTIIAAVTGTLLAIILGFIFRFYRRTRQLDPNGPSTGSLDIKDSVKTPKPGLVGRLHEGAFGANQVSEHPHAIVEDLTAKRNLQEGAHGIQMPPQHPHIMVSKQEPVFQMPTQHPHTMVGRQEFALQMPPQHPHIIVGKQEATLLIPLPHPHAIGKAELEEQ